jgi:hypothetical protein
LISFASAPRAAAPGKRARLDDPSDSVRRGPDLARRLRDAAAIVGIGQSEFSKNLGRSERSAAIDAIAMALRDAGLEPGEVDGLVRFDMEHTTEVEIARNFGLEILLFFG